jgi:hypothetical protein
MGFQKCTAMIINRQLASLYNMPCECTRSKYCGSFTFLRLIMRKQYTFKV